MFKKLVLLSALCVAASTVYAHPEIRLCYEEAPIYPWVTAEEKGLVFTEMKLIEKKLNLKFKYVRLPWKRCLQEVQDGFIDGIIWASYNPQRAQWAVYPKDRNGEINRNLRMHTEKFVAYVQKGSPIKLKNGKFVNLGNQTIGCQLGYTVEFDLKAAGYPTFSTHVSALDLLKELDYGSISVAVLMEQESKHILNQNPKLKSSLVRLSPEFKSVEQYIIFSRNFFDKNTDLAKAIWNTVPLARNSEAYQKESLKLLGKNAD